MPYQFMMVFAVLVGLFHLRNIKNKWAIIITIILSTAILLTCIPKLGAYVIGRFLFVIGMCLAILSTFLKPSSTFKKTTITAIIAFVTIYHIFQINYYPYTALLGYLLFIPIALFIFVVVKYYKQFYEEIGYLSIVTMAALVGFIFQILPLIY